MKIRELLQPRVRRHAQDVAAVAVEPPLDMVPAGHTIKEDRLFRVGGRGDILAIGRPVDLTHPSGPGQRGKFPPGLGIPDPGGIVSAHRGDGPAVRAERHVVHHVAVTLEGAEVPTISHVPERRRAIPGRGGEHRCVGAEGEGADPVVAAKLDSGSTRAQRLQQDDPLLRPGEAPTVGAKGERRVLETANKGAGGCIVDGDSGGLGPGRGDPMPLGVDGQLLRLARCPGDRGAGRADAARVSEHNAVIAGRDGQAPSLWQERDQRLLVNVGHVQAVSRGEGPLPRHVPEVQAPCEAGGDESPTIGTENNGANVIVGQADPGHKADVECRQRGHGFGPQADHVATGSRHDGKSREAVHGFLAPADCMTGPQCLHLAEHGEVALGLGRLAGLVCLQSRRSLAGRQVTRSLGQYSRIGPRPEARRP